MSLKGLCWGCGPSQESTDDDLGSRHSNSHDARLRAEFLEGNPEGSVLVPDCNQSYGHTVHLLRRFSYWRGGRRTSKLRVTQPKSRLPIDLTLTDGDDWAHNGDLARKDIERDRRGTGRPRELMKKIRAMTRERRAQDQRTRRNSSETVEGTVWCQETAHPMYRCWASRDGVAGPPVECPHPPPLRGE